MLRQQKGRCKTWHASKACQVDAADGRPGQWARARPLAQHSQLQAARIVGWRVCGRGQKQHGLGATAASDGAMSFAAIRRERAEKGWQGKLAWHCPPPLRFVAAVLRVLYFCIRRCSKAPVIELRCCKLPCCCRVFVAARSRALFFPFHSHSSRRAESALAGNGWLTPRAAALLAE